MYFSIADGLAESQYVFIEQNQLKERFKALNAHEHFVIGETGFGTGLNFLVTWQCWQEYAPSNAHLEFISTEKYPLSIAELTQSLSLWPSLKPSADQLINAYTAQFIGTNESHYYRFCFDRVTLILLVDDVYQGLSQLLPQQHTDFNKPLWRGIDAWFLDGFSPAKNPEMWSDKLFEVIARLSHSQTSLATYTAASMVQKVMTTHGFFIKKAPGFGKKRELITAHFIGCEQQKNHNIRKNKTPWSYNKQLTRKNIKQGTHRQSVAIIGAGLAGCHTAFALAQKGFTVSIFDTNNAIANEASGNPQAILYAKISASKGPLADFNLACLLYAQSFYQQFWQVCNHNTDGKQTGLLQLTSDDTDLKKINALCERFQHAAFFQATGKTQASRIAGIPIDQSGIFLPYSGWIHPQTLCHWLINHHNIHTYTQSTVEQLQLLPTGKWQLNIQKHARQCREQFNVDNVVICNAHAATQFEQTAWLPTKPLRGQVSYLGRHTSLNQLKTTLSNESYIAPLIDGVNRQESFQSIGASYDLKNTHKQLTQEEHKSNIRQLTALTQISNIDESDLIGGRANLRCTSPDYLPLIGQVPDKEYFTNNYEGLSKRAKQVIPYAGEYLRGLYLNIGYGSRGLAYTPLASQVIVNQLLALAPPLPQDLVDSVNPARFIIRKLKQKTVNHT